MNYENYRLIAFNRVGRVLTVTLNAPERLNAVDSAMHEELSRLFYDIDADNDADVVILTGAGRAFCGGGDIKAMEHWCKDPATFEVMAREAKKIIFGILDCEKPIICKMNGDAYGLGATLALFSDVIFASDKARIADPHVRVGLAAGDGGAIIWPQLIGFARAKEFLMTGDAISAVRAAEIGLINHAVPAEQLDEKVAEFAGRLSAGAIKSIKWTKISVNIALKQLAHSIMDTCMAYETLSNRTEDHAEAVDAFVNKRKPSFSGR
jgi:enoyl-CoA hydratase